MSDPFPDIVEGEIESHLQSEIEANSTEEYNDAFAHIISRYESTMCNVLQHLYEVRLFNTYITAYDNAHHFSILLKTKGFRQGDLIKHLGKYEKIKSSDPLVISSEECPICYCPYRVGEYKRCLRECNHIFHKRCIDKWLLQNRRNMTCPLCRKCYTQEIDMRESNQAE